VREKLPKIWRYIRETRHLGSRGVSQDAIKKFSSKWSIGGESPIQSDIARFMLTIYSPLSQEDTLGLHDFFNVLIGVRDLCAGRDKPYFDQDLPTPFFNGTRLQIYPSGGGFMSSHVDSTAVNTFNAAADGLFLQPLLLLTERGVDYETGGAFYVSQNGEKVFLEEFAKAGDIIVYDETISHGVGDVDAHLPLDLDSEQGRIVALSTIYK
jgi:hypothetical protein